MRFPDGASGYLERYVVTTLKRADGVGCEGSACGYSCRNKQCARERVTERFLCGRVANEAPGFLGAAPVEEAMGELVGNPEAHAMALQLLTERRSNGAPPAAGRRVDRNRESVAC